MQLGQFALTRQDSARRERGFRIALFVAWLVLVLWLVSKHVFWRDEVRAFSLALSGSNFGEMLHDIHGEGHPALWYLILRSAHGLFPYREVLPIAAAVIGIGAMAIFAFCSPFRLPIVALVLFSLYGAFEYVVMARNYGISALVMFALAALYGRVRNTLWFGVILLVLCNTNVPSCILAAALLLFRFVEMLTDGESPTRGGWLVLAGNATLAATGAMLCFITVYPTANDAVSAHFGALSTANILAGLTDTDTGFLSLGLSPVFLAISCFGLVRKPAALCAGLVALIGLKLFFYLIYPSAYRQEVLYLAFLLSLYWVAANGAGGAWRKRWWIDQLQLVGTSVFAAVLLLQSLLLLNPVFPELRGVPFSRAADVGKLLRQPALTGAIVMADPDTMLESLPYYANNPLWFLRQQRFGKVTPLNDARRTLTLDDFLRDADRLHRQTGRPIVFLSHIELEPRDARYTVMFNDQTILTTQSVKRFASATRLIARLRPAATDEAYDVYVYPR